jgi:DNA-directed RNA polymerase specialized sigma24 family protein
MRMTGGAGMQPELSRVVASATNTDCRDMLARRLKSGDESVLREILDVFGPAVARVLERDYPRLASDVDDVLGDALFRLWVSRDVYDPTRSPLRRWFFIIAQHIAIDMLRNKPPDGDGNPVDLEGIEYDGGEITDVLPPMSVLEQDTQEIFVSLSIMDQKILIAHADGNPRWAADLSGEIGMKAGAIRVRLIRLHERIEEELNRRGHNLKRVRRAGPRTIPFTTIS